MAPRPPQAARRTPIPPARPEPPELSEPPQIDEPASEPDGTYRGAALAALLWCALPLALFVGWALFLAEGPKFTCVDSNGQTCAGPSVIAWNDLPYAIPVVVIAAVLAVLIALMLRKIATGWKSSTVGFASAVVASGLVTVFWSAM